MSVIAFSTVFLVILGLMLMMMALKKFAATVEARQNVPATTAAPTAAVSTASQAPVAAITGDDSELVAAITAALTAMTGTAARIISLKPAAPRVSGTAWRMTGILQNSEGLAD